MPADIGLLTFLLLKVLYNPKAFFTHAAWLHQGFPIVQYSPAASRRVWTVSQFQCGLIILSRPARDRRLCLPHQLANPTWAYPIAQGPKVPCFPLVGRMRY